MKTCSPFFSAALIAALGGSALAQTAPAPLPAAPAPTPPLAVPSATPNPPSTSTSKSWLASRGILSVDELAMLMGAEFSPAERDELQSALAARNAAIERANAQLAAQLKQILGQGETQITARIEAKTAREGEAERMERLKRLQPSRYRELMRRKKADGAK